MTSSDILPNAQVRQHFLDRHQLRKPPLGTRLDQTLRALNFVQVDSINTLARAHDLILWSRQQSYRPPALRKMVDHSREAFEAWTHDASILPIAAFPHWRHKFIRDAEQVQKRWKAWHRGDFLAQTETVLEQIARHGPLGSGEVGANEQRGTGGWWDWHPSKTALEYLWRTGRITVSRREGVRKLYDLTENVIPQDIRNAHPSLDESRDWACQGALRALGFATAKEVSEFYDFVTVAEARAWITRGLKSGALRDIRDRSRQRPTARPGGVHARLAQPTRAFGHLQPPAHSQPVRSSAAQSCTRGRDFWLFLSHRGFRSSCATPIWVLCLSNIRRQRPYFPHRDQGQ